MNLELIVVMFTGANPRPATSDHHLKTTELIEGKIAFPDKHGPQPRKGQRWLVRISDRSLDRTAIYLWCVQKAARYSVNSPSGTRLMGIYLPDGSLPILNADYYRWEGGRRKFQGGWYKTGGIDAFKEIWIVVSRWSEETSSDEICFAGVNVPGQGDKFVKVRWCGPFEFEETTPQRPNGVPEPVYNASLSTLPSDADRSRWGL